MEANEMVDRGHHFVKQKKERKKERKKKKTKERD